MQDECRGWCRWDARAHGVPPEHRRRAVRHVRARLRLRGRFVRRVRGEQLACQGAAGGGQPGVLCHVLELREEDPEAAAKLIVILHGFKGYGDAFNAADAKLSTKWICSDFIAKINEIINKILVEAYKKALVPRKKGEDLAQMFLEDVNSFPQIANVVAEHTAYQGPIEISFESNPPPQQQEQNGNYNHYNVNNNPSNYHYNAMGLPQDPKPTEIINVKKKAFISFITFLGFPAESINYGLSSEELRDLLLLQKKYANQ